MKINEVEKETGITSANIRYYERKNLLAPRRSNENNYRVYNAEDVERLKQIKILRMMGIPISEVKDLLDGDANLKEIMQERIIQLSEEEQNIADVKKLCQTVVEYDMDINMLNEQLLHENAKLWKEKLTKVNLEEKAHHLCRKTGIILCALSLLLCFAPLVALKDRTLNILQLLLHPDFSWSVITSIIILPYLLIIIVYAYILLCQLKHKYSVDVIFLSNMAMRLATGLQIAMAGLLGKIIPGNTFTEVLNGPYFLCILFLLLRILTGFLIVIVYSSGEELIMRVLHT